MISLAEYEAKKQKRYCQDCRFRPAFQSKYCEPYVKVGVRMDDYHGPRHLVKRLSLGTREREKHNANNDCEHYVRKWWKFWVPK